MNKLRLVYSVSVCAVLTFVSPLMLGSRAQAGTGKGGQVCATNGDCAADLACGGAPRVCRPTSPQFTDEGMSPVLTGKEIPPCHADSDCPRGFRCSAGRNAEGLGGCYADNHPCQSDSDCAVGWYCDHRYGESFCRMAP